MRVRLTILVAVLAGAGAVGDAVLGGFYAREGAGNRSARSGTLTLNLSWNSTIAPGATMTGLGFNGSYSGANPRPTAFTVNGAACAVA